jgi:hypothetical protein
LSSTVTFESSAITVPSVNSTNGLISTRVASVSARTAYALVTRSEAPSRASTGRCPVNRRAWYERRPRTGWRCTRRIASGLVRATSSISMPPSFDTIAR